MTSALYGRRPLQYEETEEREGDDMSAQSFGCDFGTSSIKIYSRESDTIYCEKNMVAIEEKKGMIAYGNEAFDMHEKAPSNIEVLYPMSFGTVASITYMQQFLRSFLEERTKGSLKGAEFIVALPTDVQDRVFTTLIHGTGIKTKNVELIDKPVAAGLGLGLDVTQAQGVMLVDVGADTTEISILSLGGTVTSKLIKNGGNKIDEAISSAIRREYGYFIGNKTAEILKNELGYQPGDTTTKREICGRNMALGLPALLEITADFVANAIAEQLKAIVDAIKMILERTPPELGVDIIRNGIFLTGGVANLKGLDGLIADATNIKVNLVDKPEECVARGLERVIKEKQFHLPGMLFQPVCSANPVREFVDDLFALPQKRFQGQIQLFRRSPLIITDPNPEHILPSQSYIFIAPLSPAWRSYYIISPGAGAEPSCPRAAKLYIRGSLLYKICISLPNIS